VASKSILHKKLLIMTSANVGNWQWAAGTGCDAAPILEHLIQKFNKRNLTATSENGLKNRILGYGKPMVDAIR
jgi:deoxyribodipyrimidine photo-lyase